MKNIFFTLLTLSALLFSCGEVEKSDSNITPVEVMVKDWVYINSDDHNIASEVFDELVKVQESGINSDELTQKADEVIEKMNLLISKINSYTISGLDAEKLSNAAEENKAKNNAYFNTIIDYANIVKENTDLLLKKNLNEVENEKFKETILPIEDKVYFASDASDKSSSDFEKALKAL